MQEQIEQVQNHLEDLQKLTPELISTAEDIAVQADEEDEKAGNTRQYEQLNLLSHEWATKVYWYCVHVVNLISLYSCRPMC